MVREAIIDLVAGGRLSSERAEAVMHSLMSGEATPAQVAGLLIALRARPETVDELTGFARAMREHAIPVPVTRRPVLDTCGSGGGGVPTINVSTAAAIVAAGAGLAVAKHGNRAMTSQCGSADVLAELGVQLERSPADIGRCLDEVGLGFMFAQAFHPAMRHAAGPRRELGVRTVFNLLGPITNPAGAEAQVIGVPETGLVDLVIEVMRNLGRQRAMIVHGLLGVDEISIEGPTRVAELRDGWVRTFVVTPEDAGLSSAPLRSVAGGDAVYNAKAIRAVLDGQPGPQRDFVLLNAAAAIVVGGGADDLREGVTVAARSIETGAAKAKLEAWLSWA